MLVSSSGLCIVGRKKVHILLALFDLNRRRKNDIIKMKKIKYIFAACRWVKFDVWLRCKQCWLVLLIYISIGENDIRKIKMKKKIIFCCLSLGKVWCMAPLQTMLIGSFESILEDGGIAAIMKTFMTDQENMKKNRKYHSFY